MATNRKLAPRMFHAEFEAIGRDEEVAAFSPQMFMEKI